MARPATVDIFSRPLESSIASDTNGLVYLHGYHAPWCYEVTECLGKDGDPATDHLRCIADAGGANARSIAGEAHEVSVKLTCSYQHGTYPRSAVRFQHTLIELATYPWDENEKATAVYLSPGEALALAAHIDRAARHALGLTRPIEERPYGTRD